MIKANEVRIGNIFNWDTVDSPSYFELEHFKYLDRLKPIPLTEKLLLRFGFEIYKLNNGAYEVNLNDFFSLKFIPKDKWRENDAFYLLSNDDDIGLIIENVHTFQNLYFVLTGQELELK